MLFLSLVVLCSACSVQSIRIDVEVKGNTATVTFSTAPPHPDMKFYCKLNNGNYKT